ncbi:cytochrome P450 71AU50-like [Solanum lycopersicum]|uniref:cytochrome P450 71AU50-like n=1 Tax=Solanum lycopersicum TaxID=4081 RepID=UPI0037478D0F
MDIMQSGEAEFQFDHRHIKAILLDMLLAAMDTTASTAEWILTELLRLHPAVPLFFHEAMEDCVVDDLHIQKETRIIINCYAIHMDPNVWPDPEKFFPERFVGSSIDFRGRELQLLPFGSG